MARAATQGALPGVRANLGISRKAGKFVLRAPIVREPILHKQIADALRLEIGAPGRLSSRGVTWWSVDMAAYAGNAPGIRTGRGCIAGIPDMFLLFNGVAHFIEIKADDGTLSDAQRDVGTAILCAGGRFGLVRNAAEALACLDRWDIPRAHRLHGG